MKACGNGRQASGKAGFAKSAMVDRFESGFHTEVRQQLRYGHNTAVTDFKARLPRHELDFSPPDGAHQHATLLGASEARRPAETQQPRVNNVRAALLQDLAA